jgi:hypothetical protein
MKKTLIILFASIICASFTACGAKAEPSSGGQTPVESENLEHILEPIYGNQIKDGIYKIEVSSSSSMFRIIDARLSVENGKMSAVLTLSGTGYEKLYMGTGEEALADTDDKCVYFTENSEGKYEYEIPVEALDCDIDCAAWSIRRQTWYDRVLVFESALIPKDAISERPSSGQYENGQYEDGQYEDGQYEIEVKMSGGSGRATVESPAKLTIAEGAATARIVWSSPHYTYMLIDGVYYYPVNTGGNSAFEIPVSLDEDIALAAETVAMSSPREIEYTLRFDSATLKPARIK